MTEGLHLPNSFGARLSNAFTHYGQLCVGIDPHANLLSDWSLPNSAEGLRTFALTVLESSVGRVGIIKPQVSFFERFGAKGFAVLEEVAAVASETDLLVIMDGKRGDIGSTMDGYFDAWLAKDAPFLCDALTLSPYLGVESLSQVLSGAHENGKGVFILAATSNPEATNLQSAMQGGIVIAEMILDCLEASNLVTLDPGSRLGNFGAVVGATVNFNRLGIAEIYANSELVTPILAPGFGAQGAQLNQCSALFGAASSRVIASVSRSVLAAGKLGLNGAIDSAKLELVAGLERV